MTTGNEFVKSVCTRLLYYKDLGDRTISQLNEADLHFQPNEESNSIATIIQHMSGNMLSRWSDFLLTDGEKEWRNRDTEFEDQHLSKPTLLELWEKGWACCIEAISALQENDLLKTIHIRSEKLLVIDALNRQLAHYPYHVGQMIYVAKMIRNKEWQNLSIPKK